MKQYTAVRAGLDDLVSLAALFDDYRNFYGQSPDREGARRFLEERLSREESVVFMAVEQDGEGKGPAGPNRPVGFTQLYPSFSSVSMRRLWILNDLYVAEEARGTGAGSLLLETARAHALETGAKGLTLDTSKENKAARSLYVKSGYAREDEYDSYHLFF